MFKNSFKLAIRIILKHKGISFINVIGLATGIACSILIFLFVRFELSYDSFHEKADRIYRLAVRASMGGTKTNQTYSPSKPFEIIVEDFPEIETGVKFLKLGKVPVLLGERTFFESRLFAVDATFYDVFTIPLIHGDPETVLVEPNTMVITKSTAVKYFGNTDVTGKILSVNVSPGVGIQTFEITGISENVPDNSHFHYDILISTESFPDAMVKNISWDVNDFISYVVLKKGTSKKETEEKLRAFMREYYGGTEYDEWAAQGNYWEYYLQPLTGIHLNSDIDGEFEANGNKSYIYLFSVISIIILLIACINFMNISTAKSSLRAREVGMRKVVGSSRKNLIGQLLTESVVLSLVSFILGLVIVVILLPHYRNLVGKQLDFGFLNNFFIFTLLIAFGIIVGITSGSYPAFVLSSFNPSTVLKGKTGSSKSSLFFRNILIVFQFSISIFLIIGTMTIYKQMQYLLDVKLGFDKEQVLVINNPGVLRDKLNAFKEELLNSSGINHVSGSNTLPGRSFGNIILFAEGYKDKFTLNNCVCDYSFLKTLKLNMVKGRFFSREFTTDVSAAILNQKAVDLLGWDEPVGKRLYIGRTEFLVIGVIGDYHYESLHHEIRPMVLFLSGGIHTDSENFISVRLSTANIFGTIGYIENTWNQFVPGMPFEYSFLDEDYDNLYINENQTRKLFTIFAFLAIFIACLGLYGLASFVAEQKTKEIGIRKTFGASVPGIVKLLSMIFIKWVLLANVIAWPAAWFIMQRWLQNFSYRISIDIWVFLLGGALALIIALMTISYQTIKAATANPIETLRFE